MTRTAVTVRALGARWLPATRRRRVIGAAGFGLAATLTLWPIMGAAQTLAPNSGADLLQPSLDGNPKTPPRFRRPGAAPRANQAPPPGTFTAPSRIGATPTYGSPTGFGAGDTGFNSSNTKRKKQPPTIAATTDAAPQQETTFTPVPTFKSPPPPKPPAINKPRPADIYPAKAAARPGAVLPPPAEPPPLSNPPAEVHPMAAANRPGAAVPVPPSLELDASASTPPPGAPPPNILPLGTVPQRPLPIAAGDPYAPLGIRAGSFTWLPAVELSAGYNGNAERVTGAVASPYFVVAPELQAHSDWERHALDINIHGSYTEYTENLVPSLNVPYLDARANGRIDVLRNTQIILEDRFLVSSDNPGSPNLPAELAKLPINYDMGGTLGLVQTFNRLSVTVKGTFDRNIYNNSDLIDGEISSNGDRDFDQYAGILRVGYELNPGFKPFVEVQEDERVHDDAFDRSGLQRNSFGTTAKAGAAVDMFGSLTGEMAVGYVDRSYKDPTLPDIAGVVADGSLIWQATALTTAKLTATSQVYETVLPGTSGELSRDLALQIDHAFLLSLIGTLKGGYGRDEYVGSTLTNNRYFVSAGLAYKLNREMQLRGEVRQDWQTSTQPGFTFTATSMLIGLRLQR